MGGMVYVSLASLGLWLHPMASIVTTGVSALGAAIPSTPGYFGVIQLSFWVTLQMFAHGVTAAGDQQARRGHERKDPRQGDKDQAWPGPRFESEAKDQRKDDQTGQDCQSGVQ